MGVSVRWAAAAILVALLFSGSAQGQCTSAPCLAFAGCSQTDLTCYCAHLTDLRTCATSCANITQSVIDQIADGCTSLGYTTVTGTSASSSTRTSSSSSSSSTSRATSSTRTASATLTPTADCTTTSCNALYRNCRAALASTNNTATVECVCANFDVYPGCAATCPDVLPSDGTVPQLRDACQYLFPQYFTTTTGGAKTATRSSTASPTRISTSTATGTASVPLEQQNANASGGGLGTPAIAGIAVGIAAALIVAAIIVGLVIRNNRKKKTSQVPSSFRPPGTTAPPAQAGPTYGQQGQAQYAVSPPSQMTTTSTPSPVPNQQFSPVGYGQPQSGGYSPAYGAAAAGAGFAAGAAYNYAQPQQQYQQAQYPQQVPGDRTSQHSPQGYSPQVLPQGYPPQQQYNVQPGYDPNMRGYVAAGDPGLLAPSGALSTTSSGYPLAPSRTSSRKLGSTDDQGQSAVLAGASTKVVTIVRPFESRASDELTVNAGDQVEITREFDDGWLEGIHRATGREGVFPKDCLVAA